MCNTCSFEIFKKKLFVIVNCKKIVLITAQNIFETMVLLQLFYLNISLLVCKTIIKNITVLLNANFIR